MKWKILEQWMVAEQASAQLFHAKMMYISAALAINRGTFPLPS